MLQTSLVGLNVAVIQGTSDQATALHRHVEVDLGAHHSPDLFHGQHEVSKTTRLRLARQVRQAAFAARIHAALSDVVQAEITHTEAQAHPCEARELVRELGIGHHPYNLERGQAQPVEQVAQRLNDVWMRLGRLAAAAELPTRARERLAKAQRLTTQLLATLTFFFATIDRCRSRPSRCHLT